MKERIKILFLATGADDESPRRSEREAREIEKRLRAASERDAFELVTRWAVRAADLQEHLLEHRPRIVHLSGAGTEAGDLLLSDDDGHRPVSLQAMAGLFKILKDNIRVIVLNVPYADGLAQQLRWVVDFTVSMRGALDEETARTFSAYLYQALGYGRTVSEGFDLAVNQLMLDGVAGSAAPSLYVRPGANMSSRLAAEGAAGTPEAARQFSQIAVRDAQFIINDKYGTFGGDVRLDQGLYVNRRLEEALAEILARKRGAPTLLVVVGEAGHGKTSLLWRLYHSLPEAEGWEPLFIKSTLFLGRNASRRAARVSLTADFNRNSLLAAAAEAAARGLTPVILLDTVDLLLRDEDGRNFLLKLVLSLEERGCFVIATCRPQEAALLYSADPIRLALKGYDEGELHEAINKHAARFYAVSVRKNYAEEFAHVLNAVARGLPVREVCANPLTLRMLFTIYAPAAIPDDINVFKLYQEYWENRVERDLRAGSPITFPHTADLGEVAAAVAVAMLAEGTPELDARRLESALGELGRASEGVADLIDRGVLHDSEAGTVAFYHQTFFEHSAARALLKWRGAEGLAALRERRQSSPNDMFVSPIYEQALLLSEQEAAPTARAADSFLVELLGGDVLTLKLSGVYVYCHRRAVPVAAAAAMRSLLREAEEAPVLRFLELAPNTPDGRLGQLFTELEVIWGRGNWREQERLLKLLERLVPRDCARVRRFVEEHALLEYMLAQSPGFTGEWKLLRMLAAIAEYDPAWSWRALIELYVRAIPNVKSRELQTAVLQTLNDRADLFGADEIATRFEAATAHLNLDRARDVESLSVAYGRLLGVEWRARGRPLAEVLEEVLRTEGALRLIARMRGLVFVLSDGDVKEAEAVFACYQAEAGTPREWLWTRIVWPRLLSGEGPDGPAPAVVDYARRETARILSEESEAESAPAARRLAERMRTSVREATLPPEVLLKMLDIPALAEPSPWLRAGHYAVLLGDAFAAGHPGAVAAMNQLLGEPGRYWPEVRHVVGPRLKLLGASSERALDALIAVSLKTEDDANLLRALERSEPGAHQSLSDGLRDFTRQLLSSSSTRKRSAAVLIWSQLLRLGLAPLPSPEELRRLLAREHDAVTRGHLVTLMGEAACGAGTDIAGVVDVLAALATATEVDTREKAFAGLVRIVAEGPGAAAPYAVRVLDAALTPPTNAARLSLMRPLIKRLIDGHEGALASEVFRRLLTESRNAGLGLNGSRKILGRFKSVARAVVRTAPLEATRQLLNAVPDLDRVLGVLVVDAVCGELPGELASELDELLKRDIHGDVKQVILRYKYTHERPAGWPELYTLLHRDARAREER
ncbi:MAG TPA: hypothetical protein VF297_22280 [Pyrinomonadaceae bacterium]